MQNEPTQPRHSISAIKAATALAFDMPLLVMTSSRRDRRSVEARWSAIWLARELTGASLSAIGREFGQRDHTTVLHALRGMPALMAERPSVGAALVYAEAILAGGAL